MFADFDVHTDDAAVDAHALEEGCVENERAAVRDTGFDDDGWLDLVDDFLGADDIFGILDDRSSHPRETIRIFFVPTYFQPHV